MSGDLTRLTVNLTPAAVRQMEQLMASTGLGKTDVVERAIKVWAVIDTISAGGRLTVVDENGEQHQIYIL